MFDVDLKVLQRSEQSLHVQSLLIPFGGSMTQECLRDINQVGGPCTKARHSMNLVDILLKILITQWSGNWINKIWRSKLIKHSIKVHFSMPLAISGQSRCIRTPPQTNLGCEDIKTDTRICSLHGRAADFWSTGLQKPLVGITLVRSACASGQDPETDSQHDLWEFSSH